MPPQKPNTVANEARNKKTIPNKKSLIIRTNS
jgi:hypothetical protein